MGRSLCTSMSIASMITLFVLLSCQASAFEELADNNPSVILISSVIEEADVLVAAAKMDVIAIKYNAKADTLTSIIGKIRERLGSRKASSIGLVAHDFGEARFYLTRSETISLGSTLTSNIQRAFWREMGSLIKEGGRIDLFACNLAKTDQGKMLVSVLEDISGVAVSASVNNTGNIASGGDWILEEGKVNAGAVYFSANLLDRFSVLLYSQVKKLTASDASSADYFGHSVSISGNTVIAGAWRGDDPGSLAGSAYVFERDAGGADNWGEVKKLTASDAAALDYFGYSVSISGNIVVAGAWGDDDSGSQSGSAYIFERNAGGADNWGEIKKLTASDGAQSDLFGLSVSISGNTIVVGAVLGDAVNGFRSGSAYIFERPAGGKWGEVKKLTASDGADYDRLGSSVSISGNTVVAGAIGDSDNGSESGSAYIFDRDSGGADNWGEVKKLTASDGAIDDLFGWSVSISGNTVVAGAHFDDDNGTDSGSAYIFERDSGGADNWGEVKKLTASDGAAYDIFGRSVTISGNTVVLGAYLDDDNISNSGSAYIFERPAGGKWGEVNKLTASDGASVDRFGWSVSISGNTVVAGAYLDDDNGKDSGSAYIFETVTIAKGSIKTNIIPASALAAGAQWRLSFQEGWRVSGETVKGVTPGRYTVVFKPVKDYTKPANKDINVVEQTKSVVSGTYVKKDESTMGFIKVRILPIAARKEKARWRIKGTDRWFKSGASIKTEAGTVRIECKKIAGFKVPKGVTATVLAGKTTSKVARYTEK